MKRMTTKEMLVASFQEIAENKEFNKITIKDIVQNCQMSSATFYRHFRDKYDLIAWGYAMTFDEIVNNYGYSLSTLKDVVNEWICNCEQNKSLLLNLLNYTSGYESFIRNMVEKHVGRFENSVKTRYGENALTTSIHLLILYHTIGMIHLMCDWLIGNVKATSDEIVESIISMMPEQLWRFIPSQE